MPMPHRIFLRPVLLHRLPQRLRRLSRVLLSRAPRKQIQIGHLMDRSLQPLHNVWNDHIRRPHIRKERSPGMSVSPQKSTDPDPSQFLLIIGSTIIILALFMISLCKEYYQIFLAQGVLLGLGMSFVMLPAVATVPKYFNRSRGLALGITIGGSSLGGVIWPIALRHVLVDVGYGWGFRIAAFIMLPLLAIACLTIRAPEDLSAANQADPDLRVFNNPALMIFAGGLFFLFLGLFAPLFFVPSWAIEQGLDSNMAFYMLSIINAASLFGRLIPGLLADKFGAFNMMIVVACTMGLVACCWTKATSLAGIIVFCVAFGFSSGVILEI